MSRSGYAHRTAPVPAVRSVAAQCSCVGSVEEGVLDEVAVGGRIVELTETWATADAPVDVVVIEPGTFPRSNNSWTAKWHRHGSVSARSSPPAGSTEVLGPDANSRNRPQRHLTPPKRQIDARRQRRLGLLAVVLLAAGCAGAPGEPPATRAAPPAIRADTVSYEISGEFQDASVLPLYRWDEAYFDPEKGGWVVYFTADPQSMSQYVELITWPGAEELTFKSGDASTFVTGTPRSDDGCTFTTTRNDATGTTGSVECTSAHIHDDATGRFLPVTLRARWDANA
jgi:hypothetical protein